MNKYKELVLRIGRCLKAKGFFKKGDTFYLSRNNNWGLINFQKSIGNVPSETTFTINLGVSSTALRNFDGEDVRTKPSIEDSHWRKRIGFLLPSKQDFWWRIDGNTSLEKLQNEIIDLIITVAIPEVEQHISDEDLLRMWLMGQADGLTEFQRFIYLTTILKIYDERSLPIVVNELMAFVKGKPYESTAKVHIKELGFNYV
jgi:hypothetical protein